MGRITRTRYGCTETLVFNNSEILQLPVMSPIEIVPPVSGRFYLLDYCYLGFSWAADVTGIDAAVLFNLSQGPYVNGWRSDFAMDNTNFLNTGGSAMMINPIDGKNLALNIWGGSTPTSGTDFDELVGQGVYLNVDNDGAVAFTGGAAGNRLILKLFFETMDGFPIIA